MSQKTTTRITAFIEEDLARDLDYYTSDLGLSKNAFLNDTLPIELDALGELQPNSPEGAQCLRLSRAARIAGRTRLNVSLDRETALRLNRLCKEKGVPRDAFLNEYIKFLVRGDPNGWCTGPLAKISVMLGDPRWECHGSGKDWYSGLQVSSEVIKALRELDKLIEQTDRADQK